MSGPYFSTWERENLVKFCKEAYEKLQRQEEELQELRWVKQERSSLADALYERIEEEMQINEELRQQTAMRERTAQPQRTHWEGCEEVHPECKRPATREEKIVRPGVYEVPAPPRREWVRLAEAEKVQVAIDCGCADVAWMEFADAIEIKLKEKNNG
jgi:chromosome segregation ATPase